MAASPKAPKPPEPDIAPVRDALLKFAPKGAPLAPPDAYDDTIRGLAGRMRHYYHERATKTPYLRLQLEGIEKAADAFAQALRGLDDEILKWLPYGVPTRDDAKSKTAWESLLARNLSGDEMRRAIDERGRELDSIVAASRKFDAVGAEVYGLNRSVGERRLAVDEMARNADFISKVSNKLRRSALFSLPVRKGRRGANNKARDGISKAQNCVEHCYLLVQRCSGAKGVAMIKSTLPTAKRGTPFFYLLNIAVYKFTFGIDVGPGTKAGNVFETPIKAMLRKMRKR